MNEEPMRLRIDGPIMDDEGAEFWGGYSPRMLEAALEGAGDVVIHINSPGGDVVAASRMYTMLKEHRGDVRIVIDGLAASAASVIAMAGDTVLMSPIAYMMIHCAASVAVGDKHDMEHEAGVLEEVDKGIRTAYRLRTGLSDRKLSEMMDEETWMSAATAVAMKFADGILGAVEPEEEDPEEPEDEPEEDARGQVIRMAMNLHGLRAVAFGAKAERSRMLARLLQDTKEPEEETGDNTTVAAAADANTKETRASGRARDDAIQRLKLRLLSY